MKSKYSLYFGLAALVMVSGCGGSGAGSAATGSLTLQVKWPDVPPTRLISRTATNVRFGLFKPGNNSTTADFSVNILRDGVPNGETRVASFTNLVPGDYKIVVRSQNGAGSSERTLTTATATLSIVAGQHTELPVVLESAIKAIRVSFKRTNGSPTETIDLDTADGFELDLDDKDITSLSSLTLTVMGPRVFDNGTQGSIWTLPVMDRVPVLIADGALDNTTTTNVRHIGLQSASMTTSGGSPYSSFTLNNVSAVTAAAPTNSITFRYVDSTATHGFASSNVNYQFVLKFPDLLP